MTYTNEQTENYEENLKTMLQYSPSVYRAVVSRQKKFDDTVEWNPETGNFAIGRNGTTVYVHSQYDREREFAKILEGADPNDATIILFGLGNGQLLEAIRSYNSGLQHLIIVEPNSPIVEHFFHHYDFIEICRAFDKVSLILNKTADEAEQLVIQLIATSIAVEQKASVIATIAYRTLYPDYYKTLTKSVTEAIRFSRVNTATRESFRLHWLVNSWRNLPYLSLELGAFINKFNGKPAILVSAGPSLAKNIHLLKLACDRALIVAVGSAISILDSHGIVPHLRVALDAAVENQALFQDVDTSVCPLVYSEHLYYNVLPQYKGEKIHMTVSTHKSLERYIFDQIKWDYLAIESGFSVANTTLDFLCKLGFGKIIFMGQDLCYTEGKLHAEGSWDQDIEERYIRRDIETEDVFGHTVFTDKPFLGMKRIFENTIAKYRTTMFINATEGGLPLQGAINKSFNDVLQKDITEVYNYRQAIEDIILLRKNSVEQTQEKLLQIVCNIEKAVGSLVKINENMLKRLRDIHQSVQTTIHKDDVKREVKKMHEKFSKLQNNEIYARAILPVFENKFLFRRDAVEIEKCDWRKRWTRELEIMLLEASETHRYMLYMQELIREYKGEKKLKIIFE